MPVTVVSRSTTPKLSQASTQATKQAKAIWMKNGEQNFPLSQIFTGPYTGQWLVAVAFADLAAYAKTWAIVNTSADMLRLLADNAKIGAVMQEREILVGVDL